MNLYDLLLVVRVARSTNQGSGENIRVGVRAVGVTTAAKINRLQISKLRISTCWAHSMRLHDDGSGLVG